MFTIEGNFKYVTDVKTGARKDGKMWKITNFVIECQSGNYTTEVAFQMWENDVQIQPGTWITVDFYPQSKMYNGKYFTNLVATQIQIGAMNQTTQPAYSPQPQKYAPPQQSQPAMQTNQMPPQAPQQYNTTAPVPPPPQTNPNGNEDDLPF